MSSKFKTICESYKVFILPFISVLASLVFVSLLQDTSASIIVGADNFDVRHLYYNTDADKSSGPQCEDVIIYDPFQKTIVSDTRLRLAEELLYISEFKPKVIVFDHILPYASEGESDSILVDAIRQCLAQDIVFIAPRVRRPKGEIVRNFFDYPQYSLDLILGDFYIPIDRIVEGFPEELPPQDSCALWIPELVYRLVKGATHTEDYYRNKYLNFDAPKRIPYYYHDSFSGDNDESELQKHISGRIVVFSAYSAGDDLHNLEFAIQGVANTEQERIKTIVSGAELLWYSIRDALTENWDKQLHLVWVLIISLILTFIYCCCIHFPFKRAPDLFQSIWNFFVFVAITIVIMPLVGYGLMHLHIVLPMAIPAISLVFLNVFYVKRDE